MLILLLSFSENMEIAKKIHTDRFFKTAKIAQNAHLTKNQLSIFIGSLLCRNTSK